VIKGFKIKPVSIDARGKIKSVITQKKNFLMKRMFNVKWDDEALIITFSSVSRLLLNRKGLSEDMINNVLVPDIIKDVGLSSDEIIVEVF